MLVDSWAWIEFFKGSPEGLRVKEAMRNSELYVSILSLAEVSDWCTRNSAEPSRYLREMKRIATVFNLDEETAEKAGANLRRLREKAPGIGMIDALLYAQASAASMELLTGDPHFEALDSVVFIEKD